MSTRLAFLLLVCLLGWARSAGAQQPLPNPNLDLRTVGEGRDIIPLDDGGFIVEGGFFSIDDTSRFGLAKFRNDGTLDTAWSVSVNQIPVQVVRDGDRLFLLGGFSTVNNQPRRGLASVSISTGQLDAWNPNTGGSATYNFRGATRLGDHLYVVGDFSEIGSSARTGLAKIHAQTGALDPLWVPTATGSSFENVRRIDNDGSNLYVSGNFTSFNGAARTRVVKVDNATGALNTWAPSFNSNINSQAIDGGFYYAAGCFTSVNGTARSFAARVDLNTGGVDAWSPPITNGCANSIQVTSSQVYIAAGRADMARRYSKAGNGPIDTSFAPNLQGGVNGGDAVEVSASRVAVGGQFINVAGAYSPGLALLDTAGGTLVRAISAERTGGTVASMVPTPDGGLLVGGNFIRVANAQPPVVRVNLLKLTNTGTFDPTFSLNILEGSVSAMARSASHFYVGGSFGQVSGNPGRSNLIRLDNALQIDTIWAPAPNSTVNSLVADENNQALLVGGSFTQISGQSRNRLAEVSMTNATASSWNPNANSNVNAIVLDGTDVWAGGFFTSIGGASRARLARLSRTTGLADPAFSADVNSAVNTLLLGPPNSLYVGGSFITIGGISRRNLAKLDRFTGTIDPAFLTELDISSNFVNTLVNSASGQIYVGGRFNAIGGQPSASLARIDVNGTVDLTFSPNRANNTISSVVEQGNRVTEGGVGRLQAFPRTAAPAEIEIIGANSQVIQNGDMTPAFLDGTDFGGVLVTGGLRSNAFGISNTGGLNLLLIGNPRVEITGAHAADFTVTTQPASSIGGVGGINISNAVIRFDPGAEGLRTATVSIANNDSDENPTTFAIQGTGVVTTATTLTISSDEPENTQPHQFYRVTVTAVGTANIPLANQRVQIECDSGAFCEAVIDANGNGACELASRTPGTRTLTARWLGNSNFLPATDTEQHTVAAASTTPPVNPAFDLRAPGFVNVVTRTADDKLLVGGTFNRVGEAPRRSLARLLSDGTPDPAFSADVLGSIGALLPDSAGNVFAVGFYDYIDGSFRRNVAKLTPSGDILPGWTAANSTLGSNFAAYVDGSDNLILQGSTFFISGSPNFYRTSLFKLSGTDGTLLTDLNVEITTLSSATFPNVRIVGDGTFLYVYGLFDAVNGVPRRNLARLNPNGSVDASWNPSPNAFVGHVLPDGAGGIYLAGTFNEVASQSAQGRLVRLNSSGALITGFNPAPNASVSWFVRESNALYVSGSFTQIGGAARQGLAKLDANSGAIDNAFGQADPILFPSRFERLGSALWIADSTIRVTATAVDSLGARRVDATSAATLPVTNVTRPAEVLALARQPDGATLVGGNFARMDGPQRNLIRITPDGQIDNTFAPALGGSHFVRALLVRSNGDIYAGGFPLRKISSMGVIDTNFRGPNSDVLALVDAGDGLVAGGFFTSVGVSGAAPVPELQTDAVDDNLIRAALGELTGAGRAHISLNPDGIARPGSMFDSTPPAGEPFSPRALLSQTFDNVADSPPPAPNLDRSCTINLPGWVARNNSTTLGINCVFQGNPNVFNAQAGATNSYAALNFNSTTAANTISTWLITPRVTFTAGSSLEFWIRAPVSTTNPGNQAFPDRVQVRVSTAAAGADTDVGTTPTSVGTFTTQLLDINPTLVVTGATCPAGGISNPVGGTITGFPIAWCRITLSAASGLPTSGQGRIAFRYFVTNGGPDGANSNFIGIDSFAYEDGVSSNPNARNRIAKLDYSTGNAIAGWDPNADGVVRSLATASDGRIYLGGDFTSINGQSRQRLARLNANGGLDASWQPGATSTVNALLVQGNDVYVGGSFTQISGVSRRGLARLSTVDGTASVWDPAGSTSPTIVALARAQDGGILVGGLFRFMGSAYRSNVARLDPLTGNADPLWNPSVDGTIRALLTGYGNTPVSVRRPEVEQNVAIGGSFEFASAVPMPGFIAVSSGAQGPTAPEIELAGNGQIIQNGDTTPSTADGTDFGNVDVSTGQGNATFVIRNLGSANLLLSGNPRVTLSGPAAADFSVTTQPGGSIAPAGSADTVIRFDPSETGLRSATVTIANNDSDENPTTFVIQGTGVVATAPEIELTGNGQIIQNGDTTPSTVAGTDFGSLDVSSGQADATFVIRNLGTAALLLTGNPRVTRSGPGAADFSVVTQPDGSIAPAGSADTVIRFDPSEAGLRRATVTIANNDSDENPTTFVIQGTGTSGPLPERIFCDRFEGAACAPLP